MHEIKWQKYLYFNQYVIHKYYIQHHLNYDVEKKWKNREAVCNNHHLLLYDMKRLNHEREFLDLFKLIPQFVKFNMLQNKKECLSSIIRI